MPARCALRASDADRDAVAGRLRDAAAEGRLDPDELEDRMHAALRARTYGELDRLVGDLPGRSLAGSRVAGVAGAAFAVGVTLAAVAVALLVLAVAVTWWTLWLLMWLVMCAGRRGCSVRRV